MRRLGAIFLLALALLPAALARAAEADPASDWRLCRQTIAAEERRGGVPAGLLAAIAANESGRGHPTLKKRVPWPWTVMAEGQGRYLPSKAAAIAEVRGLQARGVRNIDVGCMQINLRHHPDAFESLNEAFDPTRNVAYAARFLIELREQTGSWAEAAGRYHSATPEHKIPYQQRVLATWARERREGGGEDTLLASLGGPAESLPRPPLAGSSGGARPVAAWRSATAPGSPLRVDRGLTMLPLRPPTSAPAGGRLLALAPARAPSPLTTLGGGDAPRPETFAQRRAQYLQQWREQVARAGRPAPLLAAREGAGTLAAFSQLR